MLPVPLGLTEEQFAKLSSTVRASAAHLGNDIQVQGSRVTGTAKLDSDLDIAIRVSPERFEQILRERFGTPNPGSAKARTMQHAIETGKIQSGEAGLRLPSKGSGSRPGHGSRHFDHPAGRTV